MARQGIDGRDARASHLRVRDHAAYPSGAISPNQEARSGASLRYADARRQRHTTRGGDRVGVAELTRRQSAVRRALHSAVPSHFGDPMGLAGRLLRSGPDGRFAMLVAGLTVLATPLDRALQKRERGLLGRASAPTRPIVFVCGPPRSGTTVVAQALLSALDVSYITNLTAVFPRSPITASRMFRVRPAPDRVNLRSHYGRTTGFHGPNDGLHLWDRWLGSERTVVHQSIDGEPARKMVRFFGAYESWSQRPLVTKNNALNAHAAIVAEHLPTAHFLCLERDPVFLAQSLLLARTYIHGDRRVPYGLDVGTGQTAADPVEAACEQVRYHQRLAEQQRRSLGSRFEFVSYEAFCRDPAELIHHVARDVLGLPVFSTRIPEPLEPSQARRLPDREFRQIVDAFA